MREYKRIKRNEWEGEDHLGVDEDIYADNWAHKRINLVPYRRFLPLAFKDS